MAGVSYQGLSVRAAPKDEDPRTHPVGACLTIGRSVHTSLVPKGTG